MENELLETELIKNIKDFRELIGVCDKEALKEICCKLSIITNAGIYIYDTNGKLLASEQLKGGKQIFRLKSGDDGKYIDARLNDQFKSCVETAENIGLAAYYIKNMTQTELDAFKAVVSPLNAYNERLGVMILVKLQQDFEPEQLALIEMCAALAALMIIHEQKRENAEESWRVGIVRSAIGTLSYSELEAVLRIFDEIPDGEGLVVASKVADKVGITRSVIVNALRKFESAGVIESRSLGMKGTYIKITNEALIVELDKMRR